MKALYKQAQIEFEIEKSRLGMTTTKAGALFERAQAKIQQAQARRDLMAQMRRRRTCWRKPPRQWRAAATRP